MSESKQTLRTLWRDKGFSFTAVAMLALGIGATALPARSSPSRS